MSDLNQYIFQTAKRINLIFFEEDLYKGIKLPPISGIPIVIATKKYLS